MAIGTATALLGTAVVAGGAFSAYSQAKAGTQQASSLIQQGNYNAEVYDQQAEMVLEKKKLSEYQSNRARAKVRGAVVSRTAGAGFMFGGSPMAIAIDNETQMLLDQAVGDYNLDVEANYLKSASVASRYQGQQQAKLARSTGFTNAFSTLLNVGTTFGMMNLPIKAGKL